MGEHSELIEFWCQQYQQHVGAKYPFQGGKDGKTIAWLRSLYSDEHIRLYMSAFFDSDDEFIAQSGYSLGVFRGCLPKVIASVVMKARASRANLRLMHEQTDEKTRQREAEYERQKRAREAS